MFVSCLLFEKVAFGWRKKSAFHFEESAEIGIEEITRDTDRGHYRLDSVLFIHLLSSFPI